MSKYCDGAPLYRQSEMLARLGIEVSRAAMAEWMGAVAWWTKPIYDLIKLEVMRAPVLHTDDTPVKVLAPGTGKTATGRLWIYLVDEEPWRGLRPPAAYYRYSPDRKGARPQEDLAGFAGYLQADAYAGYDKLTAPLNGVPAKIIHVACMAHARRYFFEAFERLAIDNNPAERALRTIAVSRKNFLFLGSDEGGRRAAIIYTLAQSAKLNGLNPHAYLAGILDALSCGHSNQRLAELTPWAWFAAHRGEVRSAYGANFIA